MHALPGAAQTIPVKKLFATASTTQAVSMQREQAAAMKAPWAGLPFVRDFEVRVRNDAFWQEYMRCNFRISPKGFGEDGALRKLFESEKNLIEQEVMLQTHEALLQRYSATIEFLANQTLNQIYNDMAMIMEDRIKVLEKSTYTTDFDLQNVIDAENNLTKLKDQSIQSAKDQRTYMWQIRQFLSDTSFLGFDTNDLVDVETVSERIRNASIGSDTDNVRLNNLKLRFLVSENEYKSEKAQDRRYISLLSFTYDYGAYMDEINKKVRYKPYDLNARYSVEVGLRLPFISSDRRDVALRKAQFVDDKADYDVAKQELIYKTERDIKDIGALITHFRYLQARQTEINAEGSLQKYLKMSGIDPLMLLSIKEGFLQNKLRLEKVRFDIYRNYLQLLDETGQLSRLPLVNYLSAAKEAIAQ
jgi:hypothetical protein